MLTHFHLESEEDSLFSCDMPVVPQIGSLITYDFRPVDLIEWNYDSVAKGRLANKIVNQRRVVNVRYRISRLRLDSDHVSIYVGLGEPEEYTNPTDFVED